MEQRSEEWFQERIGKFTASEIHRLMSDPKSKAQEWSTGAMTYIVEKAAERITGFANKQEFLNEATVWGTQLEDKARAIYEIETSIEMPAPEFQINPEIPGFGASPDGMNKDKGLEIKCPYDTSKALKLYLCNSAEDLKKSEPAYYWQVRAGMLATGLKKWDFVVLDLLLYEKFGLKIISIEHDQEEEDRLKNKIIKANSEVQKIIESLK